jgi:hypothetical protein
MTRVTAAAARLERVVRGVCAAALQESRADGIVVLYDWTPEGELAYEWLVRELGEARVWRAASLAANVQGLPPAEAQQLAAWRTARAGPALIAHPANRTALLLGGRIPAADLYPLGDVRAAYVEAIAGRWSGPPEVEALAADVGGAAALDALLDAVMDGRPAERLPVVTAVRELYERGRQSRLRSRVVPKVGQGTLGIDLFD